MRCPSSSTSSSRPRLSPPAGEPSARALCGHAFAWFRSSRSRNRALAVYRKPWMKPPADLRKSRPCVSVPAKNSPRTPTASKAGVISGYFPLCVVLSPSAGSKIDVSRAQPKQRMTWSTGYLMLSVLPWALIGARPSMSSGCFRSRAEDTVRSSNLPSKTLSSMPRRLLSRFRFCRIASLVARSASSRASSERPPTACAVSPVLLEVAARSLSCSACRSVSASCASSAASSSSSRFRFISTNCHDLPWPLGACRASSSRPLRSVAPPMAQRAIGSQ
mmetsp:Transcript_72044/g.204524  ORF Transcript_72044/g.204524 Transcript_72044/m.204524 type:complete len:276 (-) Transcript_72044:947-1774(-)